LLDRDGRVVETNDSAERLLDHADHGVAGHQFGDFCAEETAFVLPDATATRREGTIRLAETVPSTEIVDYAAVSDVVPDHYLVVLQSGDR